MISLPYISDLMTCQDPQNWAQDLVPSKGDDILAQLPPAASTFAADVDGLFYLCTWVSIFFFFLIAALLLYTSVVHRRKTETQPAASNMTHNTPLEVVWTLIPTIILMVIFVWGWKGNLAQSVAPGDALQFRAVGAKWNWSFFHPGSNSGTVGEVWVPVNRAVKFTTNSKDVLHSFYVPAFRAKRDVLPGRYQTVWFEATVEGDYPLFCAEYCGTEHSLMRAIVHVVTQEEFDEEPWKSRPDDPAEWGEQFYSTLCIACHTLDGTARIGPTFKNLWGREEQLADGSTQLVNEEYVRESIRKPMEKIVAGYENVVMTPYDDSMIPDDGVDAIITWLKTLKD